MQDTNQSTYPHRYTEDRKRAIVTRILAGESALKLSHETSIPQTTISRWAKAYSGQLGGHQSQEHQSETDALRAQLDKCKKYIYDLESHNRQLELKLFRRWLEEGGIKGPQRPEGMGI